MRLARRIAVCLAVVAGAVALSGCHEVLKVFLGDDEDGPAPHRPHQLPPPPGRAVPAASAAGRSPGRAFSGTADGQLAARMVLRDGLVKSTIKNARFTGQFTGRLRGAAQPGDDSLGLLESAQWHGKFSAVRDRRNGKVRMTGLVLSTFTDPSAGRACLRVTYKTRRNGRRNATTKGRRARNTGRSILTVLGGEGGSRTLAGSATARVKISATGALRMSGRLQSAQGRERGFPAACTRLEKQFGLTPLR
jgi:hypothetical protein